MSKTTRCLILNLSDLRKLAKKCEKMGNLYLPPLSDYTRQQHPVLIYAPYTLKQNQIILILKFGLYMH